MSQLSDNALSIAPSDYFRSKGFEFPQREGVYMIRNLSNFKVYIGSTKNIRTRINRHIYDLNSQCHRSQHLQNAFNKYGIINLVFLVLDMWSDLSLPEREQYFIDLYHSSDRQFGYNTQPIAYSNKMNRPSEETKIKIGNFFKGKPKSVEHNLKNSLAKRGSKNPNYGVPISEKQRNAIIESNIRSRRNFEFINPKGEKVSFVGLAEFCRQNNLCCSAMSLVFHGLQSNHKGWRSEKSMGLILRTRSK